ncbi:hypothetical protein [Altericroceibacterium spongiae]|uniref:hypothetical protein n=1 Tax=Altericroceibacterium spongiae TaxID=2320269 RepID=UPI001EE5B321|nr:hypothetical protein [Altericroceibacterium spongiae]
MTRERDKDDRRKFCISLTEHGRALEAELMHYPAYINRVAQEGIDQADVDLCLSVLSRMSDNLATAFEKQERVPDVIE